MYLNALTSSLSIAPMIDWSYSHFRVLMRLLVPKALIYTEMQTQGAVINNPKKYLFYNPIENPLALQLGGCDKKILATCAKMAEDQGFVEVNLNLGCPSDRVQAGRFGACLMKKPQLVAECIQAMKNAVSIPVTAKTRIGIDHEDQYINFSVFAHKLVEAGCDKLIIHARKAWLQGLSPKQNRTIPPLHYEYAYKLKQEIKHVPIILNGNIEEIEAVEEHIKYVDGVMIGRLACNNPYALTKIYQHLYSEFIEERKNILKKYLEYAENEYQKGALLSLLFKPIFNFAHGLPGAKKWKDYLIFSQQNKTFITIENFPG